MPFLIFLVSFVTLMIGEYSSGEVLDEDDSVFGSIILARVYYPIFLGFVLVMFFNQLSVEIV